MCIIPCSESLRTHRRPRRVQKVQCCAILHERLEQHVPWCPHLNITGVLTDTAQEL